MPLCGFPCGHVAQICEEFLKFWLSDEHWKVQPSKLASVRCRLKESFKFVRISTPEIGKALSEMC